jgi:hypothetical protein
MGLFLAAGTLFAGCATAPKPIAVSPGPPPAIPSPGGGRSSAAAVDLLPMLDLTGPTYGGTGGGQIDGYTRLYIDGNVLPASAQPRVYHEEDRGFWRRLVAGRSLSRVLTVNVALSEPNVSISRPLASASHESNRTAGEVWTSELSGDRLLTPYFRLGSRTTASVQFNLSATSTLQGSVTGDVLSVIRSGVDLVAPTSSLVTSLNEQGYRDASKFVDDAISRLFGESITERSIVDVRLNNSIGNLKLAAGTAAFPDGGGRLSGGDQRTIGTWSVMMEPPIVSIFSATLYEAPAGQAAVAGCATPTAGPARQACTAFSGISPHTVLGLRVGDDVTLMQSLLADAAVQGSMKALEDAAQNAKVGPARSLCNAVAGQAQRLGLNRFDEAAAVWAFSRAGPISSASAQAMTRDRTVCSAIATAFEVKLL